MVVRGDATRECEECVAGLGLRLLVVVGQRELSRSAAVDVEGVLQPVHLGDVFGAVRIDEDAHDQCGVVGPDQFTREQVLSRVAQDDGTEVILTDHPHGDVALAGIGHRDGDVLAHVDDRAAVQSVAVLADDRLVVE